MLQTVLLYMFFFNDGNNHGDWSKKILLCAVTSLSRCVTELRWQLCDKMKRTEKMFGPEGFY